MIFPANFRPTLTFKKEGNFLPGNKEPGNVIININSKPHPLFKIINDYDLITERYIKFIVQYPKIQDKDNQMLFELFPPINTGIPDSINIKNYEEYLLNDQEYYFEDESENEN